MRSRLLFILTVAGSLAFIVACGGGDDTNGGAIPVATDSTGNAIPTASPYPALPELTIVGSTAPGPRDQVPYIVRAGDTLSVIAERFDTTVGAIMERNGLTGTTIFLDQELIVPTGESGAGTAAGPTAEPTPSTEGVSTYVVQDGDTGFDIALKFGTTVEELAAANGMTVAELSDIQPDDVLQLPRP